MAHVQHRPLAQAAAADPERLPELLGGRVEDHDAGGQQPHALGRRARAGRATSAAGAPDSAPIARLSELGSRTSPTRRRSDAALPPTATAQSVCGTSRALEDVDRVLAHGAQLVERRRVRAQVAVGQRAGADEERRRPVHAAGERADRDLGRPPPTSTTPTSPGSSRPSVRVAPRNASRASSSPSRISPPAGHAGQELVAVDRRADRRPWRRRARARRPPRRQRHLLGDDPRDLVDLLARDLGRGADAREGTPLKHLVEAPVLHVGDEHTRRVRADVDAGAHHSRPGRMP